MLLPHAEPDMEPIMSSEFSPDEDAHEGRATHYSHGRHAHHHSLSHAEHHGWLEGSHDGIHQLAPVEHDGGLGWDQAAWGNAGGFEHILSGDPVAPHVNDSFEHLFAQNLMTQSTSIFFEPGSGGAIDVGGNVEAFGNQTALLIGAPSHDSGGFLHDEQFETTNIVFNVA
jgi:hypothetical protein